MNFDLLIWTSPPPHTGPVPTENVDGVGGADEGPLLRLGRAGVGPRVARCHSNKGQVGVLLMVKRSRCDLFTVF